MMPNLSNLWYLYNSILNRSEHAEDQKKNSGYFALKKKK